MKSIFRFALIVLLGVSRSGNAQFLNFSQYQMAPLLNNPSLIAKGDELKVDVGYRNQFGGLSGNYGTPFISAFKPLYLLGKNEAYKKFGAAGIHILTDRNGYDGSLQTSGAAATYAHIARLSKNDDLVLGLSVGLFQRRIQFNQGITTGSQWDPRNGAFDPSRNPNENISGLANRFFPILNAGLTYMRYNSQGNPFVTVSMAANSLNTPNVSLNTLNTADAEIGQLPVSFNVQGSVLAYENQTIMVQPTFRHIQENKQMQTNIGSYIYYKLGDNPNRFFNGNIGLGLWYSNQNAAIAALEINMRDWALGFSYDFLVSSLSEQSNRTGAPEIIIGFRKYVGKNKKAEPVALIASQKKEENNPPGEIMPVEPVKPAEPAAAEPSKEEPKKDEVSQAAPEKTTEAGKVTLDKLAKEEENKMTEADLERERARKRQVYMVPLGFRGKDPFGGTKVALTKQERAFLSKSVKFKRNVSELTSESSRHLDNVAKVLRRHPNLKIEIKGFGCDLGSDEVNQKLSQSRADKVKAYLVKRKVPFRQLNAVGMGKLKPEDDIKVD